MKPPFKLNSKILNLVSDVTFSLGMIQGMRASVPQPRLRKQNKIRSIQCSLAIEGNTLNLDQVTALVDGKRVLGPRKDILEVQNIINLYKSLGKLDPTSMKDLLKSHGTLMRDLSPDAGQLRSGAIGIFKGPKVAHLAPPAKRVPSLVENLLMFLKDDQSLSPLIKSCVFHYEFEFIHPFSDGNGRMGRFWQSLILTQFNPIFEFLPIESEIQKRQKDYYLALEKSDQEGSSTHFIEFSLETIRDALSELSTDLRPEPETTDSRLRLALVEFKTTSFSRKNYLELFKTISTATASRDLALGVFKKILIKEGQQALTKYRFSAKKKVPTRHSP